MVILVKVVGVQQLSTEGVWVFAHLMSLLTESVVLEVLNLQILIGGALLDHLLPVLEALLLVHKLLLVVDALSLLEVESVLLVL